MNNYLEIEKLCNSFHKGFESIKQYALDLGNSNKAISKGMMNILRSGPDEIAMDYEIQNSFLYMLAEIFQSPRILKQLRTKHEAALTPEGRQVLRFWQTNPAFWCYFTVKEHLFGDFWMIVDRMTKEEHILHSKGITTMQEWKDADGLSFLCIMQPNGECLQTVGVIKPYRLPVSDFLFYCTLFKPEEGLKAILSKHFIKFFTVDTIGHVPPQTNGIYKTGFIWQPFTLPQFEVKDLKGRWHSQTIESQQRFSLTGVTANMLDLPNTGVFETAPNAMAGAIIRDNITGEMGIFTNTEVAYAFFSTLLNRTYPELKLPKKPTFFISSPLQAIVTTMDLPAPWKKFEATMEHREPKEDVEAERIQKWETLREGYKKAIGDDPHAKDFKELMELFIDAQIEGKSLDVDEVCKSTGIDRLMVERLLQPFDGLDLNESDEEDGFAMDDDFEFASDEDEFDMWDEEEDEDDEEFYEDIDYIVPDGDKVYEMDDLPLPEDMFDEVLYNSLSDSEIFVISLRKMGDAHKQFLQLISEKYARELNSYGMLRSIERLFFSTFDEKLAYPVMNSFIWILLLKGKDWVPVRSYAIEMLKWIPSNILHFYEDQEEFIEALSTFVKKQLGTKGVCTLAKRPTPTEVKRGTYTIKGTGALFTLLKIREEDD